MVFFVGYAFLQVRYLLGELCAVKSLAAQVFVDFAMAGLFIGQGPNEMFKLQAC